MSPLIKKLSLIFLFFSIGFNGNGQMYIDIPLQFDFYETNSRDLDFSRRGVIVNPSVGFTVLNFDSSKFELSTGFGLFYSKLNQHVGEESFRYQRFGPLQWSLQAHYHVNQWLRIGAGGSFGVYGTVLGGFFQIDDANTSNKDDRLGDGFRSYNLGSFLEARYSVIPQISIGAKYTYWFIPQLKYRQIGDLGELSEYKLDLFASRLEFSIRLEINR